MNNRSDRQCHQTSDDQNGQTHHRGDATADFRRLPGNVHRRVFNQRSRRSTRRAIRLHPAHDGRGLLAAIRTNHLVLPSVTLPLFLENATDFLDFAPSCCSCCFRPSSTEPWERFDDLAFAAGPRCLSPKGEFGVPRRQIIEPSRADDSEFSSKFQTKPWLNMWGFGSPLAPFAPSPLIRSPRGKHQNPSRLLPRQCIGRPDGRRHLPTHFMVRRSK